MIKSIVVAMDEQRVIGKDNQLIWHLPADLKRFKEITMGHSMLMGRKTFDSIGKPLPGRRSIVITRKNIEIPGCLVVHSIEQALENCKDEEEVFIIGGADIFKQTLSIADKIYLTIVHHCFEGDTYFPMIDEVIWKERNRIRFEADGKNPYAYSFILLEKTSV